MKRPLRARPAVALATPALLADAAFHRLFALPRTHKRALQVGYDSVMLVASFAAALYLRTEDAAAVLQAEVWVTPAFAVPFCILAFYRLGFYRQVVRAVSGQALLTIVAGVAAATVLVMTAVLGAGLAVPATVPILYALIAFCTVGGARFLLRSIYARTTRRDKEKVVIYGAGRSGRQLLHALQAENESVPVAFVDDARDLHGTRIGGLTVHPAARLPRLVAEDGVRAVLIAIPSISRPARAGIVLGLEHLGVRVQIVPDRAEGGAARGETVREVMVEDLLGRDPIAPAPALMRPTTAGRSVLVTGAGGSIGSELCRQILQQGPRVLVLLEISEYALYRIDEELRALSAALGLAVRVVPLLGNCGDSDRMAAILRQFGVETVFHAAAYKHVPIVEQNIVEGVGNNVFGTLAVARAAVSAGVRSVILVSTDKAVRPTSVMGASKRLAEIICQALQAGAVRTRFSIVRFGNVMGSSGSVIPRFREQIAAGGPVTVTHPEAARFFMTVTEAAQLVIQAAGLARGGDIFVLDMGQPVRIVELARRMIRLSGLVPVVDPPPGRAAGPDEVAIVFTAMHPGEKLVEELVAEFGAAPTAHPRILTSVEPALEWDSLARLLDRLRDACRAGDLPRVRAILAAAQTGYRPAPQIVDQTWTGEDIRGAQAPADREGERLADRVVERLADRAAAQAEPAIPQAGPARRDRPTIPPVTAPTPGAISGATGS